MQLSLAPLAGLEPAASTLGTSRSDPLS